MAEKVSDAGHNASYEGNHFQAVILSGGGRHSGPPESKDPYNP